MEERTEQEKIDRLTRQFIYGMCRTCKFYDNKCTKGRIIRKCAEKGLKNRE